MKYTRKKLRKTFRKRQKGGDPEDGKEDSKGTRTGRKNGPRRGKNWGTQKNTKNTFSQINTKPIAPQNPVAPQQPVATQNPVAPQQPVEKDTNPDFEEKRGLLKYAIRTKQITDSFRRNADERRKKNTERLEKTLVPNSGVLKVECKNPDNCLAFGKYGDAIKSFFNNFNNLELIDNSNIKGIGSTSLNGFVFQIPFIKNDYKAYTVLKCSSKPRSDNLYYEYYVGKHFINKFLTKIPCFVETYGCYLFKNLKSWQKYNTAHNKKQYDTIKSQTINKHIEPFITEYTDCTINEKFNQKHFEKSCKQNKKICVLIQHFDNVATIYDEYKNNFDNVKYDIFNLYYQVYFGLTYLNSIQPSYTHYDLHPGNVLLYKPYPAKQYILMRYHSKGTIYEFKTDYICKIIDYGRNYFNLSPFIDTSAILKGPTLKCNERDPVNNDPVNNRGICEISACRPNCGKELGYNIIQGKVFDPSSIFYDIYPDRPNMSHDLRLVNEFNLPPFNASLIYNHRFGTPHSDLTTAINGKINNIFDMKDALEKYIPTFNSLKQNKKYDATWTQAAVMDIYDDATDYVYEVTSTAVAPVAPVAPVAVAPPAAVVVAPPAPPVTGSSSSSSLHSVPISI